jgi:hypothetical protein
MTVLFRNEQGEESFCLECCFFLQKQRVGVPLLFCHVVSDDLSAFLHFFTFFFSCLFF